MVEGNGSCGTPGLMAQGSRAEGVNGPGKGRGLKPGLGAPGKDGVNGLGKGRGLKPRLMARGSREGIF